MHWATVGLLSSLGIVMALLSIRGCTRGIEPFLWIILATFATLVIARVGGPLYFLQGLVIGLAWGVLNGLLQATFFSTYAAHNPESMQHFAGSSFSPRLTFLLMGPVVGLVTGLVLGALCWAGHRLIPAVEAVGPPAIHQATSEVRPAAQV